MLARMVIVLMVAFVALGVAMHGLSVPVGERIWQNLLDRQNGPMTFRFILQPIMASGAALVDGLEEARSERNPYLWTHLSDPGKRGSHLYEGLSSTARAAGAGSCIWHLHGECHSPAPVGSGVAGRA